MNPALLDPRYAEIQDYLFSLKAKGLKFGIDRMRVLAAALGHPERAMPVIHLAGTNGKGSTGAMIEAILRATGRRTGLYTSPHLVRLGERVQVDRQRLTEAEIVRYVDELRPVAEAVGRRDPDEHPSFFEFMTAMAFLQFQRQACDVSIIEVGLGGRLDATNIVHPEISVITSIGLDHCEMLGSTLAQIAFEKGGIIKPGRPVVMGRLPAEAEAIIRRLASERGCVLHSVREVFGESIDGYPHTSLEGDYQRWNAGTATLVARALPAEWGVTEEAIEQGLTHAEWPGRWQHLPVGGRDLILDASHNPEGAEVLGPELQRLVRTLGHKPVAIVGVLGAVRAAPLLTTVARHAREIHLVVPQQARACTHAELAALVPATFEGPVVAAELGQLFPTPRSCTAGLPGDTVVVTGSIYLIGEVLSRLQPEQGANEARLQDF